MNILVVEDDRDLRDALLDALQSTGNHFALGIDCAESLPEQKHLLHIDCAIVDLNLPDEDGISLSRRLRQSHPELGIIMLSARARSEERAEGYASGADIYLTKPASLKEVEQAVLALSRRIGPRTSLSKDSFLFLHSQGLTLSCGERRVTLSQNEATTLAAFSRAQQMTMETWQIAELLGLNLDSFNKSTVELHISRIRKKIESVSDTTDTLRSIRNVGYRLCVEIQVVG